jgi:hypothetical protein
MLLERTLTSASVSRCCRYDSHLLGWSSLQRALRTAASPVDAATAFQISRDRQTVVLSSLSPSMLAGWLNVQMDETVNDWRTRHEDQSARALIAETLQLLSGRTARSLTSARLWANAEDEDVSESTDSTT